MLQSPLDSTRQLSSQIPISRSPNHACHGRRYVKIFGWAKLLPQTSLPGIPSPLPFLQFLLPSLSFRLLPFRSRPLKYS